MYLFESKLQWTLTKPSGKVKCDAPSHTQAIEMLPLQALACADKLSHCRAQRSALKGPLGFCKRKNCAGAADRMQPGQRGRLEIHRQASQKVNQAAAFVRVCCTVR